MALIKESIGSFRTYLLLAGTIGGLFHLNMLCAPQRTPADQAISVIEAIFCALFLYLGVTLRNMLQSPIGTVVTVFRGVISFHLFLLPVVFGAALLGGARSDDAVSCVISVLIAWYFLANARRLHAELVGG